VGAVIGGLLIGALAGAFFLAPRLRGSAADAPAAAAVAPAAPVQPEAPGPIYAIENMVLNPAQSAGRHFLMFSVALEVSNEPAEQALRARDAEVRDAILGVLGSKTMAELANIAQRDSLRGEVLASIGAKFPAGTVRRIYFPQFVLQ
jgi:flagellar FliL protein